MTPAPSPPPDMGGVGEGEVATLGHKNGKDLTRDEGALMFTSDDGACGGMSKNGVYTQIGRVDIR